jgi:photosystem II stability/assembly factor-like uncharacterized protein/tetratricopeptide (TPR) repeat protein
MSEWVNPYIAGAPVTEAKMFFGRADIFDWIERSLTGRYADHILVVHGQRRVGKTSVLKQLHNRLPERYVPVFFDFQGRTHTTLDRFLWWLSREIVRVLKQDRGISVPMPEKDAFTNDPDYLDNQFLPNLQPALGDRTLLLTFDEFDNLEEAEVKQALARPLVDYLRRLMGNPGLNFIFSIGSSGRKLENMQASYTEFFKTALYKKISFLDKENCFDLITRPVEGVLEYDRDAVNRIYAITSGHPYFTQLLCHELFSQCQKTEQRQVREGDVAGVLDDVIERGTVNLKFVWDEASDLEKWILAGLAQIEGKRDPRTLADFLRRQRVRFSEPDLNAALLHLREKDVLANDNRFVIYLLHLWLQENRPIEQVREELTEVNPIANRYIEIGLEFRDNRQYDKAIESFQQALSVDSDNIQAQVSIAATYLDQKLYDKAVVEFERALTIDDEDIAARAGLCDAHLAVGDQALAKARTKEAAQSYQKVLAINTEHTEARQQMAEIQRQRAEKALADGRDEEALSAFEDALKFTPEDQVLAARYAQVRKEKRAKVVNGLLARVEKEQSAKNWDRAAVILEEALRLFPDDAILKTRVSAVREEQRAARLVELLARADQAAVAERWNDAIAALNEYLTLQPEDTVVQTNLAEAQRQKRESQLYGHKARARGMAKFERWDEALAAWRDYLAMEPGDREAAQTEIAQVERLREMGQTYSEAHAAMTKKNYDRAIQLLKSIVVQEADYKDASRLMAEAIELRRQAKPFWQNKWLLGSIGAAGIVIAAAFVFSLFQPSSPLMTKLAGATKIPTLSSTAALSSAPILVSSLTPTSAPTPTGTPTTIPTTIPLSWARLSSGQFFSRDRVTAITIDPTDPGVWYVGTANAGIYKSLNAGVSWQPPHSGLGRASVQSLVIDPQNPRMLYASVRLGGVSKTINGAEQWQASNKGIELPGWAGISTVLLDPHDTRHLYYTQGLNVYESDDRGESWSQVRSSACPTTISDMVIHPTDSRTLFAADVGDGNCRGGVYKSSDNGRTWTLVGLEVNGIREKSLVIDNQVGSILYASTSSDLYGSSDGGNNWKKISQNVCTTLVIHPDLSGVAYCGMQDGSLNKTTDSGKSWNILRRLDMRDIQTISFLPKSPNVLFVGGQGLVVSTDGGSSWVTRNSGLGGSLIELRINPADSSMYAEEGNCLEGSHLLYRSQDNGRTWTALPTWTPTANEGCGLAFDAGGSVFYRAGEAVFRSEDSSKPWVRMAIPLNWSIGISAHPKKPGTVSALYARNNPPYIYISSDTGKTWQGVTGIETIHDPRLFFDNDQGQIVYAVGDTDIYRSEDGGNAWKGCDRRTDAWSARADSRLVVDPRKSSRIILATRGNGILVSENGCQSWQPSNNGLGNWFVNTVAIDPKNPDRIYAGTESGVYISSDSGKNWGSVNQGLLGATVVYSIVVDPKDPSNVYAATPYGVFKLEGK